jgi:RNA recognition motif-containing protein
MTDTEKDTTPVDVPMETPAATETETETKTPRVRPAPMHEGRIIVRNLVFDIREIHLTKAFAKFGTIDHVNVPLNSKNNQSRGFGFVEFTTKAEAQAAVDGMNGQTFKGRSLTCELSLPK